MAQPVRRPEAIVDAKAWNRQQDGMFLNDLANRMMKVPAMFGIDQGDVDRVKEISREMFESA